MSNIKFAAISQVCCKRKVFLKILKKSLENAGVSLNTNNFIEHLRTAASVKCYIYKLLISSQSFETWRGSFITDTILKRMYESRKVSHFNLFDTCATLTHMSWNKKWTDLIIIHAQFSRDLKTFNWFEVFETKNYKRTNSDRRNIDLSSIFKICVSLTRLKPVFLFISFIFWCFGLFNHYVALLWVGGWGVGEITFVQKCYGKRRVGEFLFCFTMSDPVHFEVN